MTQFVKTSNTKNVQYIYIEFEYDIIMYGSINDYICINI